MGLMWITLILALCAIANGAVVKLTEPSEKDSYWGLDKPQEEYKHPVFPHSMDAFEPHMDKETMEIHYNVIFKKYTQKLNDLLKRWRNSIRSIYKTLPFKLRYLDQTRQKDEKHAKSLPLATSSLIDMWRNVTSIPYEFQKDFFHYGGGYMNHLIYFSTMAPNKDDKEREPSKEMVELIERSFHNYTLMKKDFNESAEALFGTGWVYVVRATGYSTGEYLTVMSTLEEMTPMDNKRIFPILALDVWEHAYFRKYKNNRAEYIRKWWKLVDWNSVERLLNWWNMLVPVVKPPVIKEDL